MNITVPASGTCYYNSTSSNCTTSPKAAWPGAVSGTAADNGGETLQTIQVAIENPNGMWWNGSSLPPPCRSTTWQPGPRRGITP